MSPLFGCMHGLSEDVNPARLPASSNILSKLGTYQPNHFVAAKNDRKYNGVDRKHRYNKPATELYFGSQDGCWPPIQHYHKAALDAQGLQLLKWSSEFA